MSVVEPGTLYVCATPIGNLADITLRVLDVLGGVDLIAAEDTRHSRKLLSRYDIKTPVTSYHEHNEYGKTPELVDRLVRGQAVALISDAGMPGISDPGSILMEACRERGIAVDVLPGPNAAVTALVLSGLSRSTYFYGGFLPVGKKRKRVLRGLTGFPCTLVFYEAPHRLVRTLRDLLGVLGDRDAAVCRELTKVHQQVHRGTLKGLLEEFEGQPPRGECCLVVAGAEEASAKVEAEVEMEMGIDTGMASRSIGAKGLEDAESIMGAKRLQDVCEKNAMGAWDCGRVEVREGTSVTQDDMRRMWVKLTENGMEAKGAVKEVARRLGVPKRWVYQVVMVKEKCPLK